MGLNYNVNQLVKELTFFLDDVGWTDYDVDIFGDSAHVTFPLTNTIAEVFIDRNFNDQFGAMIELDWGRGREEYEDMDDLIYELESYL